MLAVKKQNTLELHSISKRALKARDSRIKMNRKKTRNSKKQHKNLNSSNNYAGEATTTYSYNNKQCNNNADNTQQQHQQKQQSSSRLYCVLSQTQPNSAKLSQTGIFWAYSARTKSASLSLSCTGEAGLNQHAQAPWISRGCVGVTQGRSRRDFVDFFFGPL